ncbi:hypothetical protein BV25DRAFT_1819784 [Artomyces pyxidatus]|uniref:Uncharacterized protein n=1 Tax=Artomyces pyxidatus TaxID=48021 RepID=A0ACB8TGC9_9AGAM|nr:hypothetical protein BV25DRAFT_1819784 [Artomyces pyxidatus]
MPEIISGYVELSQRDSDDIYPLDRARKPPATSSHVSRIIRYSTSIILACTLVDALAFLYLAYLYAQHALMPSADAPLELRSTYIGFDKLYSNGDSPPRTSPHAPIINLPRAISRVSSAEPSTVFDAVQWHDSSITVNGVVPDNVRTFQVSPEISTIVQFRAIDYGMENCTLTLALPAPHSDVQLDVWALSTSTRLDVRTLSWKTRPPRTERVGHATNLIGEVTFTPFQCSSGSYHTFEVSCATGGDCAVDFTIRGGGRDMTGLYVMQYQTV